MARAGDTIENPLSGERITFLETTGETAGESLRFEYYIPPGFSVPEHVHVGQEERHEIFSGTLRGRVAGDERLYVEGQKMVGPAGVPHAWGNSSDEEGLLMVSELRPALRFETLLENAFALAGDLKTNRRAAPGRLLRLAVLLDEARDDFYPTQIPMPVWKAFLAFNTALAGVGRFFGYDEGYAGPDHIPGERRSGRAGTPGRKAAFLAAVSVAALAFALLSRRGEYRRA